MYIYKSRIHIYIYILVYTSRYIYICSTYSAYYYNRDVRAEAMSAAASPGSQALELREAKRMAINSSKYQTNDTVLIISTFSFVDVICADFLRGVECVPFFVAQPTGFH